MHVCMYMYACIHVYMYVCMYVCSGGGGGPDYKRERTAIFKSKSKSETLAGVSKIANCRNKKQLTVEICVLYETLNLSICM